MQWTFPNKTLNSVPCLYLTRHFQLKASLRANCKNNHSSLTTSQLGINIVGAILQSHSDFICHIVCMSVHVF
jgi:hypothetical protein